jgi:hypothetical protein
MTSGVNNRQLKNKSYAEINEQMNKTGVEHNGWLWLTLPIIFLLALASGTGVFVKDFYYRETTTLKAITEGIDLILLFGFLPALVVSAILARRGSLRAMLIWLGMLGILIYAYGFNAVNLHFNSLFLVYVALLGCVLYAFIGGIVAVDLPRIKASFSANTPRQSVSVFLAVVAVLFYIVWLREVGAALINGDVPISVANWNVPTSMVHVIDMAILLPGMMITAVWLWRGKALGYVLAGVMLVIILTMTSALLAGGLWQIWVGVFFRADLLAIFAIISIIDLGLLILFLKELQE